MAAFEINAAKHAADTDSLCLDPGRLREEPIIASKIYDSCRQQDCLTANEIGPARAAEPVYIDGELIKEGEILVPPHDAAAVTIENLKLRKIIVVDKKPCPFKNGFWDIDVKYVFEYVLTFREADGDVILCVKARSIFNKKVTLFGSASSEFVMGTDLFKNMGESTAFNAEPFIWVEGKAVALAAEIRYCCKNKPHDVAVTIGLFTIIQIFRLVNLKVESRGFSIPRECDNIDPTNPCEFFDALDFPMDIFAPPQRPEFVAGISGNIPRSKHGFSEER
ncbi:MAG: hypothetical protein FWE20_10665 [Defluviitaleaceae bacterium]|nr:hypothetical protein [Defluviitaleaceae bacterium]